MRAFYLSLILLLLFRCVTGQVQTARSFPTSADKYEIVSISAGSFFPNRPGHDVSQSFPYVVTDVTGTRSQESFDGELHGSFTNPLYMLGVNIEVVRKHLGLEFGGGGILQSGGIHGMYFDAGYGYVVEMGGLSFKPGVDLYYLQGDFKLGSIDNYQKEIRLLGYTAHDQFTVTEDDGSGNGTSVKHTYDAERLDVKYRRSSFHLQPKIEISAHIYRRLVLSLEAGYMVQLTQKCSLQLQQRNDDASTYYTVGHATLNNNGNLTGPCAAFHIGFYM